MTNAEKVYITEEIVYNLGEDLKDFMMTDIIYVESLGKWTGNLFNVADFSNDTLFGLIKDMAEYCNMAKKDMKETNMGVDISV